MGSSPRMSGPAHPAALERSRKTCGGWPRVEYEQNVDAHIC